MPRDKRILIVEDDATLNHLLTDQLRRLGLVATGVADFKQARDAIAADEYDLALLDFRLPDTDGMEAVTWLKDYCPVVMLTAYGSIDQAVQAVHAGALDYLIKPISQGRLEIAVRRGLETRDLHRTIELLETQARAKATLSMIGRSAAFEHILEMVGLVAEAETTVLIEGESGVGKELVAQSLHACSNRRGRQLVTIDCCTLQESLLESELFGHERGAFTGADRKKDGLIEMADGGTVFLDEIGEISPSFQAKLLRVLETGRFRRVGGTRDISANVRFVAATNRRLAELVSSGDFREDLYYRLSAFVIAVPPLRERRQDIVPIAEHFLETRQFMRKVPKTFHAATARTLSEYGWPGNVRELRNAVERGLLMSAHSSVILPEHLGLPTPDAERRAAFRLEFDHDPTMLELRQAYIERVLADCHGNKARAARVMGISERNLYRLAATIATAGTSDD